MKLNNWELIGDSFYRENIAIEPAYDFYRLYVDGKYIHGFSITLEEIFLNVENYLKLAKDEREVFKFI